MKRLAKSKTVRTMLYEDCSFSVLELELLHTPIMQRLYYLKQLGFTDRIFPDAVHSRFNHILGVADRSNKIIDGILASLEGEMNGNLPNRESILGFSINSLIEHVKDRRNVIRLIALLHDITHIPFGHTLEDELHIFETKHDDPQRQVDFFNILTREFLFATILKYIPNFTSEILEIEVIEKNDLNEKEINDLLLAFNLAIEKIEIIYNNEFLKKYCDFLFELETSFIALLCLDDVHKEREELTLDNSEIREKARNNLFITKVIDECKIERNTKSEFNITIDAFTLDIVGNTICADLLDYIKRDSKLSGLKFDYDDRIFRYFTLIEYQNYLSIGKSIHLCLQLYTSKLRYDVVSEIITSLRIRYLLSERVLLHPTKCSAGAMLGLAVYMLGIDRAEIDFFRIGDSVFLKMLEDYSIIIKKIINEIVFSFQDKIELDFNNEVFNTSDDASSFNEFLITNSETFTKSNNQANLLRALKKIFYEEAKAVYSKELFKKKEWFNDLISNVKSRIFKAHKLLWQINARQYYKKVFRIAGIDVSLQEAMLSKLSDKFKNKNFRYNFERKVEKSANLPYGSIVIHCPKRNTTLKAANVLVFGTDPENVIKFKDILKKDDHDLYTLKPYLNEAKSIEDAYKSIWNLYFFAEPSLMYKWPFIESKIIENLEEEFEFPIPYSKDLHYELKREYNENSLFVQVYEMLKSSSNKLPFKNMDLLTAELIDSALFKNKTKSPIDATKILEMRVNLLRDELSKK